MATETRLIDVDAQIASIKKQYCAPCKEHGQDYNEVRCRSCWVDDGTGFLEDAPIVDAVEVVRCKACQHWQKRHETRGICLKQNAIVTFTTPDFYCACGERRTDP